MHNLVRNIRERREYTVLAVVPDRLFSSGLLCGAVTLPNSHRRDQSRHMSDRSLLCKLHEVTQLHMLACLRFGGARVAPGPEAFSWPNAAPSHAFGVFG